MGDVGFDSDKHEYTIGGNIVPGVTQVIEDVVGSGFEFASDWHKQRGKALHACAPFVAKGLDFKYDPRLEGKIQALRKFFAEVKPDIQGMEEPLFSKIYGFAGRPDFMAKIGQRNCIGDWKSSVDKTRLKLQLGGYSVLYGANKCWSHLLVNYGVGIELKDNGKYKMTEPIDLRIARNEFLALLTTYKIKRRLQ